MTKVTGFLSALLIEDLAAIRGVAFKYPDRLTRTEVAETLAWAKSSPEIAAAVRSRGTPAYKAVMLYKGMLDHFDAEHPQDAGGEPAAWPERTEPRGAATAENPLGNLLPDEAQALLAWSETSKEYTDAYHDGAHGSHAAVVARTQSLHEIAGRADAGADAANAEQAPGTERAATKDPSAAAAHAKKLDALRADPAYLDAKHPNHKAAVEAVTRAYEVAAKPAAALPSGRPSPAPAAPANTGATPQQRIAAIRENPDYWNRSAAGHEAAVQEAAQAFAAAYPEAQP